ncbi:unnamed protein product, partial [Scytosiphon promiscuus]
MVVVCRRHAAWSIATFTDGLLSNFILPLGPLLLLSHLELAQRHSGATANADPSETQKDVIDGEMVMHWAVVAKLWSQQAFAGFIVGRTTGRVLGPVAASRVGLAALVGAGVGGAVFSQAWLGLGLAGLTGAQFFWARTLGGFLTGALCSGALSLTAPCPRSSSCKRCVALPGSRYFSEISPSGKGDFDSDPSTTVAAGLRRADARWHLGLSLGLLVGGVCYGRGGGGGGGGVPSWLQDKPAFMACTAACSCVLAAAALAWRRTDSNGGEGGGRGRGGNTVVRCRGVTLSGSFFPWRWRVTTTERKEGRRVSGNPGAVSSTFYGSGGEDEADAAEGAPLLAEESVHNPGFASCSCVGSSVTTTYSLVAHRSRRDIVGRSRYLAVCKGNATAAMAMRDATTKWRAETGAEHSLSTPQPTLEIIRECYPYFAHGRSKKGEVVVYEQTGKMQFGRLADAGVTPFDMQMHYAFFNDFVFERLLPADDAQLMTVLDVGELRMATLKNNTVVTKYLAATAEVMQKHYPERQSRILVVNAPWWFAGIWKGVAGVLSSGTQAKLQIRGTNFLPTLLEHIPPEYGGSCPHPLGYSTEEVAFKELAASLGPTSLPSQGVADRSGLDADTAVGDEAAETGRPTEDAGIVEEKGGTLEGLGSVDGSAGGHAEGRDGGVPHLSPRPRENSAVSAPTADGDSRNERTTSFSSRGAGDAPDRGVVASDGGHAGSSGTGGRGVTQRFASAVRRMRGNATRAYLGVENKFRYDTARRVWDRVAAPLKDVRVARIHRQTHRKTTKHPADEGTMEDDAERNNSEKNLIRAIQAAQQARGGALKNVFASRASSDDGDVRRTWRMDGPPPTANGGDEESTAAAVLALQLVWIGLEAACEALLPLWMLSPGGHGGLGFSAADTGVVLAIAVAGIALPRYCSPAALYRMAARSPVRTLRAATAAQIIAATFLSGLATSAWSWTNPFSRDATFAAVTVAVAASRAASAMLARPALGNLVGVALGHAGGNGASGGGGGGGVGDGHHTRRRRLTDGTLLAVAAGVSQSIGVLAMGAVFSKAVAAGADAGVVSFRLVAAAFVGVYLATLVVHSSDGTAGTGTRGRWRGGTTGPWLPMCDCVEQAAAATTVSSPSSASYTLGRVW